MILIVARVARTRWLPQNVPRRSLMASQLSAAFCSCCTLRIEEKPKKKDSDPRISDLGRAIEDDYANIRDNYGIPTQLPPDVEQSS
jgi:triacylglycerol lipase